MKAFPFPDKINSRQELARDLHYHKIPAAERDKIADRAWETGAKAARELIQSLPDADIYEHVKHEGLTVEFNEKDNVVGNLRYFSEYFCAKKKIIMYVGAIKKWAESNKLALEKALEIILAHELYHHLECTKLGLTSKQYMVPTLQIGRFKWGKSSILALSEIGAHGFAYTYYELQGKKGGVKAKKGLMNAAINVNQFRRTKALEAIYKTNPLIRIVQKKRKGGSQHE
ncbi:MAG TPA: hypothetical protein GXZ97_03310 [Hydrogenispora sp.]|jgi:hypothetical protein|nr:hypothetical protein [Hydrogenispora sp.]